MKSTHYPFKTLLVGLTIGGVIGGGAVWYIDRQISNTPKSTIKISEENSKTLPSSRTGTDDISPAEMYYTLEDTESKSEFDRLYVTYQLQILTNQIGMNRLAQDKADRQEVKQYAEDQTATNDSLINLLRAWEKSWGFTHH